MQDVIESEVVTAESFQSDNISIREGADNCGVVAISEIDTLVTTVWFNSSFDFILRSWSNFGDFGKFINEVNYILEDKANVAVIVNDFVRNSISIFEFYSKWFIKQLFVLIYTINAKLVRTSKLLKRSELSTMKHMKYKYLENCQQLFTQAFS